MPKGEHIDSGRNRDLAVGYYCSVWSEDTEKNKRNTLKKSNSSMHAGDARYRVKNPPGVRVETPMSTIVRM